MDHLLDLHRDSVRNNAFWRAHLQLLELAPGEEIKFSS